MNLLDKKEKSDMKQKVMAHWDLINRLAGKRFQSQETAEDAALYVLDGLATDDWQRIRGFRGKSRFSTFLSSVVYRLLEDYSREKFGRVTPPKWVRELGGLWLLLFRLLCLERFSFADAVLKATLLRPDVDEKTIDNSAEHLLAEIPDCGKSIREEEYDDGSFVNRGSASSAISEEREEQLIVEALAREVFGERQSRREEEVLNKLFAQRLELKAEEQLLLRLRFREGLAVKDIGKMLGLNRFQVNGRLRRTHEKIRNYFKDAGCEEELRLLLN